MARGGFRTGSGDDPLYALRQLRERAHKAKQEALATMGVAFVRQLKIELSTPGTGRRYKVTDGRVSFDQRSGRFRNSKGRYVRASRRFRWHRASAPGQPPAVLTGALRNSIQMEMRSSGVRVGTNAQTAPWLNDGTKDRGGTIAPRPFMEPAFKKVQAHLGVVLVARLRRAARR